MTSIPGRGDRFTPRYVAIEQELRARVASLKPHDALPSDAVELVPRMAQLLQRKITHLRREMALLQDTTTEEGQRILQAMFDDEVLPRAIDGSGLPDEIGLPGTATGARVPTA